jgi:Fuc2NAc and GlcNAc transferase
MTRLPEIIVALVAGVIAAFLVPIIRRHASSLHLVDIPNERSSHVNPVPRGAGVAVIIAVIVGAIALYFSRQLPAWAALTTVGGALLVGGIGYADDRQSMAIGTRLLIHFIATAWALFWMRAIIDVNESWLLAVLVYACAAVGIVWALNLYNFMDGIDGIALQEAVFISVAGVALLWSTDSPWIGVLLCLAVSCVVTLKWNWAPAKIFLGDSGSAFIGFILAVIAVDSMIYTGVVPWVILWGVFVVDASVTLLTRIVTRQRWYSAHRSHAYQRLSRAVGSHAAVSSGIFLVNIFWLLPWALLANNRVLSAVICFTVAICPLAIGAILLGAGRPETES